MSLLIASFSGTIYRPDPTRDPTLTKVYTTVASNVPGQRGQPSGTDRAFSQETVTSVLLVGIAVDLQPNDEWADSAGRDRVVWTQQVPGLGLDVIKAGLIRVTGVASAS